MKKLLLHRQERKHKLSENVAVFISIVSLILTALGAYIHHEMDVSVTNAVQQTQIDTINKRLDYLEAQKNIG